MHFQTLVRQHWLFICILVLAVCLRSYRLTTLTTFGRDQGIDFLTVKQMIEERKPTLLGIQVSLAEFHQGPIYLYFLVPLFLLLKFSPIAGAVTAVIFSSLAIICLYFLSKKYFGQKAALLSTLLFAVSPELVREGNTPLYQHFLPVFIFLAIFSLLKVLDSTKRKQQIGWVLIVGFLLGLSLELHFLTITFTLAVFFLILRRVRKQLYVIPSFLIGITLGLSPTLLFEVRHQFLNTHLLLKFLTSAHASESSINLLTRFSPWLESQTRWFGADQPIIGGSILLLTFFATLFIRMKNKPAQFIQQLFSLTFGITVLFAFGIKDFQAHYLLPVLLLQLILFPVWLEQLPYTWKTTISVGTLFFFMVNTTTIISGLSAHHGYTMPEGWSLQTIQNVSHLIATDDTSYHSVNIASLLDGDTRAYPIRYALNVDGVTVDPVENYPSSQVLYVVSKTDQTSVQQSTVWEIDSFRPFTITKNWPLNDGIWLYRLEKVSK